MKIAVTGGTGFIGKRLVKRLHEEGHSITLLTRSPEKAKASFSFPVDTCNWDAKGGKLSPSALSGIHVLIHLAGEGVADKRWTETRKKEISDSRVLGTRDLVNAVTACPNGPSRFISASAIGIYGDRGDEELTESSTAGTGFLASVCSAWEAEVQKLPAKTKAFRVRIGIVLGNEGGALKKMLPIFKLGAGGPIGSGNQWMSWIHVDDLVGLFCHLVRSEKASGAFNGVSPNPVTNREFAKALGKALGKPAFLPAPAFALKLAMGELSALVLDSEKVAPKKTLETGYKFQYEQVSNALSSLLS